MNVAQIVAAVLAAIPHIVAAEPALLKTAADLAHGEGGIQKVQKFVSDLKDAVDAAAAG